MEIQVTVEAKEIVRQGTLRNLFKAIFESILNFIESKLGSKLFLKIPPALQNFNPTMFLALETAGKLKELSILKEVKRLERLPDEPKIFRFHASSPQRAYGTGCSFQSEEAALWKCLAENTERFLWMHSDYSYIKNKIINTSYVKIKNRAVDIFSLAGFSVEQKKQHNYLNFTKHTKFDWIPVLSLNTGQKKLCPVQLLSNRYFYNHVNYAPSHKKREPLLRWSITTGLATGKSWEEATVKGILEVIERDAFMITYLNKLSPLVINLDYLSRQDEEIKEILKKFKRYQLEVHILKLPTDFTVNVIAAVIIDRTGSEGSPAFAIGASADFNIKNCVLDALSESLKIRLGTRNFSSDKFKNGNPSAIQQRLDFWSSSEKLSHIEFLISGPSVNLDLTSDFYMYRKNKERRKFFKKRLTQLIRQLNQLGYEAYTHDLTHPDIKHLGLECRFILIPKLQPMHLDERLPYLGGKRLSSIPAKLGYAPAQSLNKVPHPFS